MYTKAEIAIRVSEVVLFLSKIPPHFFVGICLTRLIALFGSAIRFRNRVCQLRRMLTENRFRIL
jgi:hypothetical protein